MYDSSEDRRAHPRMPIMIPVEYSNITDFFVDYALDISHGGMFIATEREIEPGTEVEIRFKLPELGSIFVAKGTVVRRGATPKLPHVENAPATGIGIKFHPLSPKSRNIIERLWRNKIHG